jgi:hypothetical protein
VPSATVDWLLAPSNPPVRTLALREVLGRAARDPEVVEARAGIAGSPWVRRLLRRQDAEGWWVNPRNCYTPRGVATVWHLQVLAELGAPGDDPRIVRACERFVDQNVLADGGFACGVHRARYSEECLTGHMLAALVRFGRGGDPVAAAARRWLLGRQLPDGGWNCVPGRAHSSFVSTLGPMKALALMSPRRDRAALARAVEFLLAHRVFYSHTTGRPVRRFWPPEVQFPAHYAYDLLQPLRTLALAGAPPDHRLDDALRLLAQRADRRMRWRVDRAPEGMLLEAAGRPGRWVTASALAVLRHFGRVTPP